MKQSLESFASKIESESVQKLEPVGKILERLTGKRPTPATVCRFTLRGSHGELLRSTMIGNRRFSCELWVRDWMQRITEKTTPERARTKSESKKGSSARSFSKFARTMKTATPTMSAADTIDAALDAAGV